MRIPLPSLSRSGPDGLEPTVGADPLLETLKRALDAGIIGQVFRITLERLDHGPVTAGGSVLWSFAPRAVATLLYLLGTGPDQMSAQGANFLREGGCDEVHLELRFGSGTSAHIHLGWYWPVAQSRLLVLGQSGMIVLDEADQSLTLHRKFHDRDGLQALDLGTYALVAGRGDAEAHAQAGPGGGSADGMPEAGPVVSVLQWAERLIRGGADRRSRRWPALDSQPAFERDPS
jgi:predicted dehydrogenase